MKNQIKLFSFLLLATFIICGCSKEDDLPDTKDNNNNNTGEVYKSIYYFQGYNLKSLNLDNQGGATFVTVSNNELTNEIYGIAYDPSDGTFFGWTNYYSFSYSGEYYESYNPVTKNRIKVKIGENTNYHSVCVNTKLNKKILVKYGSSLQKVIFQEVSSQGVITHESSEIDLGEQVSDFKYISSLNAFVAKADNYSNLSIAIVNADTYALEKITITVDYPDDPIGTNFNYSDLDYDSKNNIIYYLRSNGLYVIDLSAKTARLVQTDWIAFFQGKYGYSEELSNLKTFYYPTTNELIIEGDGFFGATYGSTKFFAINLTTNKAREIKTVNSSLSRVYGFAVK